MNPSLEEAVQARIDALQAGDPNNPLPIPVDLVTVSASGWSEEEVTSLVERYTEGRQFGIFGEPRVNLLLLNLALDGIQ